jgi:hypothetical protein
MPIGRHGSLAMMPSEPIQTDLGFADVYLIKARSMGGISGSPVFVRPSVGVGLAANHTDGGKGRSHSSSNASRGCTDRSRSGCRCAAFAASLWHRQNRSPAELILKQRT